MSENLIDAATGTPWSDWQHSAHLARATWLAPEQLCPARLGCLGSGAACSLVVAVAVATPGGQQQVVGLQQLFQVTDQEGLIAGQCAVLEVEPPPVQAVEVQV